MLCNAILNDFGPVLPGAQIGLSPNRRPLWQSTIRSSPTLAYPFNCGSPPLRERGSFRRRGVIAIQRAADALGRQLGH